MNKSETIAKLADALAKAQGDIKGAVKDSQNPFFHSSYADLAAVWEACRQSLRKSGLSVIQFPQPPASESGLETVLVHSSGEWISGEIRMKPVKDDPQGWGSCITYFRRYGLAAIVGIAQVDDDGNEASGKPKVNTKEAAQEVQRQKIEDMKEVQLAGEFRTVPAKLDDLKAEMAARKTADEPHVKPPTFTDEVVIEGKLQSVSETKLSKKKQPFVEVIIAEKKYFCWERSMFEAKDGQLAPLQKLFEKNVRGNVTTGEYPKLVAIDAIDISDKDQLW